MNPDKILQDLNDAQREAVSAPLEHLLVLAGAGSGKTRVLVHRIAWLLSTHEVSPYRILAVTFTNKAASEMRIRIQTMLNSPVSGMWIGTFHGLAHRLLRAHWQAAGLPQAFQVLDADDQYRIIRRLTRSLGLDEENYPPRKTQWFINQCKEEGLRPDAVDAGHDMVRQYQLKLYQEYENTCRRAGLVDFAELLLRSYELWKHNDELLQHYRQRFQHLLVDEFQDTNSLQYEWIKLLAGEHARVFIVGDDDQSIYGWRGAKAENLESFRREYQGARMIRLEQNYRSTNTILTAANALIANNSNRLGKELWSAGGKGELIDLYAAFNEVDEARYVVNRIQQWILEGGTRQDVAILYRSNAQSRLFEKFLCEAKIDYTIYGGYRFYERAEVKDVLAYLRLTQNRDDDASFERIINTPTRGIGEQTVNKIRLNAREQRTTLWSSALALLQQNAFSARAHNAVQSFVDLIERLAQGIDAVSLPEQVLSVVEESGLRAHFAKDKSEKGQSRLENLDELVNAAKGFEKPEEDEAMTTLASFLSHTALESGEGRAADDGSVQLMTLHSAKGLEFPVVFLVGLEHGLFPHSRSIVDPAGLEEERRLCYVGMTRARQKLILSYAESRQMHGNTSVQRPSCFLSEIPAELIADLRPKVSVSRPVVAPQRTASRRSDITEERALALGQRVRHARFGEGIVMGYEGDGAHTHVHVNFKAVGDKRLVLAYAKLEAL